LEHFYFDKLSTSKNAGFGSTEFILRAAEGLTTS